MRPEVTTKKIQIIMRSDTYTRWHEFNPVLKKGEIACVVLGRKIKLFKVGDGVTEFKKLKYVNLEDALANGYIFGTYYFPHHGPCEIAVCIETAPDYVYDRLTDQDIAIGEKI